MANPTASVNGMKSERTGSLRMNVGMNTERMQSIARSRTVAVVALARRAAQAMESVWAICQWVFSMVTVASSTRMPMARASPPSDMMLMVFPVSHRPISELVSDRGMLMSTTSTLRRSWRKTRSSSRSAPRRSPLPWPRS